MGRRDPGGDRVLRLLRDLKLHRSLGLLLHNNRPGGDVTALDHIMNAKADQIAPAQLAVDGGVEQREFPAPMIQLQSNPNGPDLLQLQRWFLTEQLGFVPRYDTSFGLGVAFVMADMNGSSVEGKEPHVDLD